MEIRRIVTCYEICLFYIVGRFDFLISEPQVADSDTTGFFRVVLEVRLCIFCLLYTSAVACCAFTFLLGGGPLEMLCAFFGAGIGNWLRATLTKKGFTLLLCVASSVALACMGYAALLKGLELAFHVSSAHQAGYICAMLFIIPGFRCV